MARWGAAVVVAVVALAAPSAAGSPGLLVGVTDDAFLHDGPEALAVARDLGLQAYRVALPWAPGQRALTGDDVARLDRLVPASLGLRVVVTVYGTARAAPRDDESRDDYCATVRDLLDRYPTVRDVVIWNEPNLSFFWQPQYDARGASAAPAAYETLLARCWDVLHASRPDVNVIMGTSPGGNDNPRAESNVSHSPPAFIRRMGDAYRASGRTRRIFDTVGHNPYGASSAEPPWQRHLGPQLVGEGDVDRIVDALREAFGGTGQPVPGACGSPCVSIWYLEAGYQTVPDAAHRAAYTGRENDDRPIADGGGTGPTQSTQLADAIALAACQPYVGAFFNFLLRDEPDLARWQSGVLWADGDRKASYGALRAAIAAVSSRTVDCSHVASGRTATIATDALLTRVEWPALTAFSVFNVLWEVSVETRADARVRATLTRVDGRPALRLSALVKADRPRVLRFPAARLPGGTYRVTVTATRAAGRPLTVTRRSAPFTVS